MVPGLALLVLLAAPAADPCGDPARVSQAYPGFEGTVLEVMGPVTLRVEVAKVPDLVPGGASAELEALSACQGQPCTIRLVNLDPPTWPPLAATAQRFMRNQLGRSGRVSLLISPVQGEPGAINALVYPKHYKNGRYDMQELLLDSGLATYRSFGPYAVDGHSECRQKLAEQRAKDARRGLWYVPKASGMDSEE